jgi:hypothetical protein
MQATLTELTKIVVLTASTADGTSAITSTKVDMAADGGWDEVTFVVDFETAAADNILKAQQSSDDGSADNYSDIAGSAVPVDLGDTCQRLNIVRPTKRYLKCVATRGTSTVLGTIIAILSRGRKPYAPSDNYNVERLVSPAEGTA